MINITYDSILAKIGDTPLLRLNRITSSLKDNITIYAKLERFNPGGSVKDRAAFQMIKDAMDSGALTKDKIILDATSGNTGIAYAMISAVLGYRAEIVLPKNASTERKKIISGFGAKITYSSELEGSDGAIRLVKEIYKKNPEKYYLPNQYGNPSNWKAHYLSTGPEILTQTKNSITHFIATVGTGGTITGTGKCLKEFDSKIKVIAVEPDNAMHGIEGVKHMDSSIVPEIYDRKFADDTVFVNTDAAYEMSAKIAQVEGLAVGYSSGAALVGAFKVAQTIDSGVIVIIFPDGGDRYLSHMV